MEISINKKNPQYCSKKCKYYSRYPTSFTCDKYQCKLKMLFRVEGVKRLDLICNRCEDFKLGFKNIHKIELFSKKEMKSAYSSGFVKGYFIGIASLTAVAYVIPLIF